MFRRDVMNPCHVISGAGPLPRVGRPNRRLGRLVRYEVIRNEARSAEASDAAFENHELATPR